MRSNSNYNTIIQETNVYHCPEINQTSFNENVSAFSIGVGWREVGELENTLMFPIPDKDIALNRLDRIYLKYGKSKFESTIRFLVYSLGFGICCVCYKINSLFFGIWNLRCFLGNGIHSAFPWSTDWGALVSNCRANRLRVSQWNFQPWQSARTLVWWNNQK